MPTSLGSPGLEEPRQQFPHCSLKTTEANECRKGSLALSSLACLASTTPDLPQGWTQDLAICLPNAFQRSSHLLQAQKGGRTCEMVRGPGSKSRPREGKEKLIRAWEGAQAAHPLQGFVGVGVLGITPPSTSQPACSGRWPLGAQLRRLA